MSNTEINSEIPQNNESETNTGLINNTTGEKEAYIPKSREYYAKLSDYEGPLDILLHFVQEDELNIYDIPIRKITSDFLGYIDYIQSLDIELAGEFLLMASELMKIKARMLLPRKFDEEKNEFEEDPRMVLVRKLLEYKRFKDASEKIDGLVLEAQKKYDRGYNKQDPREFSDGESIDYSLKNLTILNLIKGYRNVLIGIRLPVVHPIEIMDITPETQRDYVLDILKNEKRVEFLNIMGRLSSKLEIVCTFLTLLQLALEGFLRLEVNPNNLSDFYLEYREDAPAIDTI
jgi:segregation and condensation protein A